MSGYAPRPASQVDKQSITGELQVLAEEIEVRDWDQTIIDRGDESKKVHPFFSSSPHARSQALRNGA
jgi:hypothetical protein